MPIRRKGQRWEVRVNVGGRRLEQRLPRGASRADAQQLEAALRRRLVDLAVGRTPRRLIDEALEEWIATSASRLRSWQHSLRYRVGVLRGFTAGRYLDELPDVAREVRRSGLRAGARPATINRYLSILRRVGNLAERWGWTEQPLGRRIDMLAGETSRHVYLTVKQVRALAQAAGGELGDAILFATLTGLRRGEMLRLTPAMLRDGCILLDAQTKGGKPRAVPMPPEAQAIARKRVPWRITESQLRIGFERARRAAGLPHVRFHDLRHTYASWLVQQRAPLTAVRDLLGHSSLAVTSRYAHLAAEHLREEVDRLTVAASGKRAARR